MLENLRKVGIIRRMIKLFRRRQINLGFYGPVNAGKTTLANKISMDWVGREVGTVSEIPHETREVQKIENVAVKTDSVSLNMNLIDMPGIATQVDFKDFMAYGMTEEESKERAKQATKGVIEAIKWLENVDAVLVVLDSTKDPYTQVNITIIGNLEARKIPAILVANKIDAEGASPEAIANAFPQHVVVPVSAIAGTNIERLYEAIEEHLA